MENNDRDINKNGVNKEKSWEQRGTTDTLF